MRTDQINRRVLMALSAVYESQNVGYTSGTIRDAGACNR